MQALLPLVCGTCNSMLPRWALLFCLLLWTTLQPSAVRDHSSGGWSRVGAHHNAQAALLN